MNQFNAEHFCQKDHIFLDRHCKSFLLFNKIKGLMLIKKQSFLIHVIN
jgi:hypothetical protein